MSNMKLLASILDEIGSSINPLTDLTIGTQLYHKVSGEQSVITNIYNQRLEFCKHFGIEGISVLFIKTGIKLDLWFDNENLRKYGLLGEGLQDIEPIPNDELMFYFND